MADSGIKKVIVQTTNLPVLSSNGNYYMRYRIISDTKKVTSAWSPIYELTPNNISTITGGSVLYKYDSDNSNIYLNWNIPTALTNASFDVFAQYYMYGTIGTVSGTGPYTANITVPSSSTFTINQTITATAGTGTLGSGTVTVTAIPNSTTISVSSTATMTAGTIKQIVNNYWNYLATTTSNSFTYSLPTAYKSTYSGSTFNENFVKLRVQVVNYSKTILDSASLFETSILSTKSTVISGGNASTH